MGFRLKIAFSSIILVAIAVSVSGYLLLHMSTSGRWDTEIEQAAEENSLICATLVTAADSMSEVHMSSLGEQVRSALSQTNSSYMLYSLDGVEYYSDVTAEEASIVDADIDGLLSGLSEQSNVYLITRSSSGSTYIIMAGTVTAGGQQAAAVSFRNVTSIIDLRDSMLLFYRIVAVLVLVGSGIATYALAGWLTRPIADLAKVSSGMAGGDYSLRCNPRTDDEIGDLGRTFNFMADSIEQHIEELTEENRRKEEFVANFTHEIKTPMTSVIGYADMIRSRNLSEKTRTLAADYIFNEGMRLQTMSLKLLEFFVTSEDKVEMKRFSLRPWVEEVSKSVYPTMYNEGIKLRVSCPNISMTGDPDLLKTAFINILDNARKASGEGSTIAFRVKHTKGLIVIEVEDHGIGIPQDEIEKITEAFYMVDKSRTRESGGAGLGLALTNKILNIHGAQLKIISKQGVGTIMSARFPVKA